MLKKLDTTKMNIIIVSLSCLNFPPKHLAGLFLVIAWFSLQSNEKCFLPSEPGASFCVYFLVQTQGPWQSLSLLQFFPQSKVRIMASLIAPSSSYSLQTAFMITCLIGSGLILIELNGQNYVNSVQHTCIPTPSQIKKQNPWTHKTIKETIGEGKKKSLNCSQECINSGYVASIKPAKLFLLKFKKGGLLVFWAI